MSEFNNENINYETNVNFINIINNDNDIIIYNEELSIPIMKVENQSHDCVIDIPDSQPEENMSASIALSLEENPVIIIKKDCKLLGKGQDEVCCGSFTDKETGKKGNYLSIYDGHGGDPCINLIRSLNQEEIMSESNPVEYVVEKIKQHRTIKKIDMANSGSTFVYAKIFTEDEDQSGIGYIDIGNVGDSELAVFINGELVFKTTPQNAYDPIEMERLKRENRVYNFKPTIVESKPLIHANNKITMESALSINFREMNSLVPSQSLGHNENTGYAPEYKKIIFDLKRDHVKVVCGSDGLWDMLNKEEEDKQMLLNSDAAVLCSFAERRWKQEWNYHNKNKTVQLTSFPSNGYDDIGIATFEYRSPS